MFFMRQAVREYLDKYGKSEARFNAMLTAFPSMQESITKKRFFNAAERVLKVMQRKWQGGSNIRAAFAETFKHEGVDEDDSCLAV